MVSVTAATTKTRAPDTRSGVPARLAIAGAAAASVLVFFAIQSRLEVANARNWDSFMRHRGVAIGRVVSPDGLRIALGRSSGPFLALLLATVALVLVGWRRRAILPIGLVVGAPFLVAALGKSHGLALLPAPLGLAWHPGLMNTSVTPRSWIGATVDTFLVAAPSLVGIVALRGREPRPHRERLRFDTAVPTADALSLLACVLVVWLVAFTQATADATGASTAERLVWFAPFLAVGLMLGVRRPWCLPVCAAVVLLQGSDWFGNLLTGGRLLPSGAQLRATIPYALVVGAGALRTPVQRVATSLQDHTRRLLLITNGLNVADAALTLVALHDGQSAEANPMVRWMGLPAKLVLVALASALIARYRPRALIWPALALGAVLAWHVSGLVLNGV